LTYNNDVLPDDYSVNKVDLQLFFKRLRKRFGQFRYFAVGEYGAKFGRPHYHAILFGFPSSRRADVEKSWAHGFVDVKMFTPANARYVAKYATKLVFTSDGIRSPQFTLMSRRPGIGLKYLIDHKNRLLFDFGVRQKGKLVPLPRYYASKIYVNDWDMQIKKRLLSRRQVVYLSMLKEKGLTNSKDVAIYEAQSREQVDLNIKARVALKGC
jgi:hypothetical protein